VPARTTRPINFLSPAARLAENRRLLVAFIRNSFSAACFFSSALFGQTNDAFVLVVMATVFSRARSHSQLFGTESKKLLAVFRAFSPCSALLAWYIVRHSAGTGRRERERARAHPKLLSLEAKRRNMNYIPSSLTARNADK
jgi:hypothetical protein